MLITYNTLALFQDLVVELTKLTPSRQSSKGAHSAGTTLLFEACDSNLASEWLVVHNYSAPCGELSNICGRFGITRFEHLFRSFVCSFWYVSAKST